MLLLAAGVALRKLDNRSYRLGAVGIRADGTLVTAYNSPAPFPEPNVHAEARLCCKLTPGSQVWVARVRRDGTFGISRPCPSCLTRLRSGGVDRVVYTVSDTEHGVIDLKRDTEASKPMRGARAVKSHT